jgi:competence protein ComGC
MIQLTHQRSALPLKRYSPQGLTVMELFVVIVIIVVLASLTIPAMGFFKRRAQDAGCMSNLRSLHASFSAYMLDHERLWPQVPDSIANDDNVDDENDRLAEFWIRTLEPYGAHRDTWLCPSERATFAEDFDEKRFDASYIVTQFEDTPDVAYRWQQPWLVERGGFHSSEANMVMPDGSLKKERLPMGMGQ